MKKTIALFLSVILLLATLAGCGSSPANSTESNDSASQAGDDVLVLRLAISGAQTGDTTDLLTQSLKVKLEEAFAGRLEVNLLPYGSIDQGEIGNIKACMMGDIDMTMGGDASFDNVMGNISFLLLPGLFDNYDEVAEYYWDGWMGEELASRMEEVGLIRVGNYDSGFRMLATNTGEIHSISDMAGLKIRVAELPYYSEFYKNCGVLPVAMSPSEALTAIEQGTVNGCDNSWIGFTGTGTIEVTPNICVTNYAYSGNSVVVNKEWWSKLSTEDQELFKQVADEQARYWGQEYRNRIEEEMKEYEDNGEVVFTYPDDEFKAAMHDASVKTWDYMADYIDADIMERIYHDFS